MYSIAKQARILKKEKEENPEYKILASNLY